MARADSRGRNAGDPSCRARSAVCLAAAWRTRGVHRPPVRGRLDDPGRVAALAQGQQQGHTKNPFRNQRTGRGCISTRRRGAARGHGRLRAGLRHSCSRPRQGPGPAVYELIAAHIESRLWRSNRMKNITRIGIGGPVGSGKTAVIEAITPILLDMGVKILIITNDVVTTEDAKHVQRALRGVLVEERIIGVETGACPHTAVREDPSMNLAAVEDMEAKFPDSDLVLIESGGDNLTLTFSPALVDFFIYVIDVAAGDKIPRKNGPGITHSDLLVINKEDLAPYVGADLGVMRRDAAAMRPNKPTLFTDCRRRSGVTEVARTIV